MYETGTTKRYVILDNLSRPISQGLGRIVERHFDAARGQPVIVIQDIHTMELKSVCETCVEFN